MINKESMSIDLIHYGNDKYDPTKFKPIKNDNWIKPIGGLWASPINSNFGWKEWSNSEDFGSTDLYFKFNFTGNILIINSLIDLKLIKKYIIPINNYIIHLDFEKMIKDKIDAMLLTEKGQIETRYSHPENLCGWDCESICIFNPNGIKIIK